MDKNLPLLGLSSENCMQDLPEAAAWEKSPKLGKLDQRGCQSCMESLHSRGCLPQLVSLACDGLETAAACRLSGPQEIHPANINDVSWIKIKSIRACSLHKDNAV